MFGISLKKTQNPVKNINQSTQQPAPQMQQKEQKQEKRNPNYVEAWGWAVAAARFRGILLLCLSFCFTLSCLLNMLFYFRIVNNTLYLKLDDENRPIMMQPTQGQIDYKTYCRDVAMLIYNVTPSIIQDNFTMVKKYFTPTMGKAFDITYGPDYIKSIRDNQVIQSFVVQEILIEDLKEKQFNAKVRGTTIRSDKTLDKTNEYKTTIEFVVLIGKVTVDNPWGLYIDHIVKNDR